MAILAFRRSAGGRPRGSYATYGALDDFPAPVLGERRDLALLFKRLATLRTDAALFRDVDQLTWRGATDAFDAVARRLGDVRLVERSRRIAGV